MRIEVIGQPAPQGSKRHVGRGIMVESSKKVGPWREAVRAETQRVTDESGSFAPGQAVRVEITFYLTRPRSHYGTGRNAHLIKLSSPRFPAGTPDVDKLARAVLDGLVAGTAIHDDGQIVMLTAVKLFADKHRTGCVIYIHHVTDEDEA